MDFFDLVILPLRKSTKPDKRWRCKSRNHIIHAPEMPASCPECKKEECGIWISMFEKVVD